MNWQPLLVAHNATTKFNERHEYDVASPRRSFAAQESNSLVSISMLKIKGLAAKNTANTVKDLFTRNNTDSSHFMSTDLNPEDVNWEDFNNSDKLKDNLDILLQCKKMNIHFEVAHGKNMPGIVVVPKFHCRCCYQSWLDGNEAPHNCDQPSNPIRGAPIALDERANAFLKDRDVTFIEIRGRSQSIYKGYGNRRLTFDFLRDNNKGSMRHIRHNSFVDNMDGDNRGGYKEKDENESTSNLTPRLSIHYKLKKSAKSKASELNIALDKKMCSSVKGRENGGERNEAEEKQNITTDPKDMGDSIQKYGGLTNSQARVFVNRSLLDAETASKNMSVEKRLGNKQSDQKRASSVDVAVINGIRQKQRSSKKKFKSSRKGKRNKNSKTTSSNAAPTNIIDSTPESNGGNTHEPTLSALETHEKQVITGTYEDGVVDINVPGCEEKEAGGTSGEGISAVVVGPNKAEDESNNKPPNHEEDTKQTYIAQNISLQINAEDTANDILVKAQEQKVKNQESRQVSGAVGANSNDDGCKNGCKDERYLIQGGDLLSKQNERRVSMSKDGLGYRQSFVAFNNGSEMMPDTKEMNSKTRLQLKLKRGLLTAGKRGSVSKRDVKNRPNYELPPVELSKSTSQAPGCAEILDMHSRSVSANENDRPSSRSHLNCQDSSSSDVLGGSQGSTTAHNGNGLDVKQQGNISTGTRALYLAKKQNIFSIYQGRKNATEIDGEADLSSLSRAALTPSPVVQQFPRSDLMAMNLVGLTSSFTFSFHQLPIQYKKHKQALGNVVGKKKKSGTKKSNKSKKK